MGCTDSKLTFDLYARDGADERLYSSSDGSTPKPLPRYFLPYDNVLDATQVRDNVKEARQALCDPMETVALRVGRDDWFSGGTRLFHLVRQSGAFS